MKTIFTAIALLCTALTAFSQDFIYTTDGKKEEVKVLEIRPNEVRYKKASNPNGPDYVILKSQVLIITYENGTHESFPQQAQPQIQSRYSSRAPYQKPFDSLSVNFGRNFISMNTIDLVNTNLMFSYEGISANGKFGLRIPVIVGFGSNDVELLWGNGSIAQGTVLAGGIDFNIYPSGQGAVKYFIAPSFMLTTFYYQYYYTYWDDQLQAWMTINERRLGRQYAVLVKHGLLVQVSRNFNMSFVIGLGLRENDTSYSDYLQTKAVFEFNVGYRF